MNVGPRAVRIPSEIVAENNNFWNFILGCVLSRRKLECLKKLLTLLFKRR